jgi:hypothetical protein
VDDASADGAAGIVQRLRRRLPSAAASVVRDDSDRFGTAAELWRTGFARGWPRIWTARSIKPPAPTARYRAMSACRRGNVSVAALVALLSSLTQATARQW